MKLLQIYEYSGTRCKYLFRSAVFVQFMNSKKLTRSFHCTAKNNNFWPTSILKNFSDKEFYQKIVQKLQRLRQCYNMKNSGQILKVLVTLRCS